MLAVDAEGQAEEISLLGIVAETSIWKITKGVSFEIENGKRLFAIGSVRAVAAVEEHGVVGIRRNGGCRGEIVDAARLTRNLAQELGIGHLGLGSWITLACNRNGGKQGKHKDTNGATEDWHGGII